MKCTLNQVYAAQPAIEKILKVDMPIAEAFLWGKLVKAINEELGQFEDCRKKLVDKYATEEDGKYSLPPENKDAFNNEVQKLLAIEVKMNIQPLDIASLGDIKISAIDVLALEPFLISQE